MSMSDNFREIIMQNVDAYDSNDQNYIKYNSKMKAVTLTRIIHRKLDNGDFAVLGSNTQLMFNKREFQHMSCYFDNKCSSIPKGIKYHIKTAMKNVAEASIVKIFAHYKHIIDILLQEP